MNHFAKAIRIFPKAASYGFTIMELAVVVAIGSVLMAVAAPPTIQWLKDKGVQNAADQLAIDLQRAKLLAIQRDTNCTVTINAPGDNQYTISIVNEVVDLGKYRGNVVFSNAPDASAASVTFTPRGLCLNTSSFYLINQAPATQARRYRIRATAAGGISVHLDSGGQWI